MNCGSVGDATIARLLGEGYCTGYYRAMDPTQPTPEDDATTLEETGEAAPPSAAERDTEPLWTEPVVHRVGGRADRRVVHLGPTETHRK